MAREANTNRRRFVPHPSRARHASCGRKQAGRRDVDRLDERARDERQRRPHRRVDHVRERAGQRQLLATMRA
jgi:hypothetical protein